MICIYHNRDLDGYCSAAIVKRKYPDCKLIGYDYGLPFDFSQLVEGERVVMVDVSLPMADMCRIGELSGKGFTWIDHHKSAKEEYDKFLLENKQPDQWKRLMHIYDENLSACELTWMYIMGTEVPEFVTLLGEYDTWRNKDKERWENKVLPFQFGMRVYTNSPETFPQELFDEDASLAIKFIINNGETVIEYQQSQLAKYFDLFAFEHNLEGLKAVAINMSAISFESSAIEVCMHEKECDILLAFIYNGKFWKFSIRTLRDDIDCAALAKQFGGGGHRKAAGFEVQELSEVLNLKEYFTVDKTKKE